MILTDRNLRALLFLGFIAASVFLDVRLLQRTVTLELTFEIAAERPALAQLFYNTGQGFTEMDSAKAQVQSNSLGEFQRLSFALPAKSIQRFRFDPAEAPGTFLLRDFSLVDNRGRREPLNARRIGAFHEIAQIRQEGTVTRIVTVPGAHDPSIELELNRPVRVWQRQLAQEVWPALGLDAGLGLCLLLIWRLRRTLPGVFRFQGARLRSFHFRIVRLGEALSDVEFIRFDTLAMYVYLALVLCFAASVAADLNGSSSAMINLMFKRGRTETPLLGEARAIRSDEWGYATPDVLSQALRTDRFGVAHSNLGSHSVALLGNLPVRHPAILFRPQFWGFFLLPVDYGYAFFWQSKALLLLLGTFTWILLLSGSSKWSLTGALWFFFSPSTQWSYSWASALPEMIGLSCFACVAFCYLTVGKDRAALFAVSLLAIGCSLNFAFCSYLPHMVPLVWMQVAVFLGWCFGRQAEIRGSKRRPERVLAVAASLCVVAFFGALVFRDVQVATAAISNTVYPGHRLLPGGTMPPLGLAAQLLPWDQTENHFPPFLGNVSEGSGFLWLAPIMLLCLKQASFSRVGKALLIALAAFSVALLAWLALPLPIAVGHWFGLDRTFGARCIPALGLANIGLVSMCLAKYRPSALWLNPRAFVTIGLIGTSAFLLVFTAVNNNIGHFFSVPEVVGSSAFLGLVITLIFTSRHRVLPFLLVGSQALFFGDVNPVQRGVGVFTSSELYRVVHSKPAFTRDEWLLYSNQPTLSGFFAGVGCQIYTGTRYLPDIDHFPLFASRGLDPNAYNRLGYLLAVLPDADNQTKIRLINPVMAEWKVAPTDPILPQLGIRYLAFDDSSERPTPEVAAKLIPLADHAVDGFWLYQLP